jgi:hypothetical protein
MLGRLRADKCLLSGEYALYFLSRHISCEDFRVPSVDDAQIPFAQLLPLQTR